MASAPRFIPQLGRIAPSDQRDHPPHEHGNHRIEQGDQKPGDEQADEQALGLAGEMPIERREPAGRLGPRRLVGRVEHLFEQVEHGLNAKWRRGAPKPPDAGHLEGDNRT
jgi:hypothetical protein